MELAKKKVSIYSIAEALHVSASTVSRALQDHPAISMEMKEQVKKTAKAMNYKPNTVAVNLKRGKCNTIGVVVPNINKNFFAAAIEGIEEEAYVAGYDVLICQSHELYKREKALFNSLSQGKVDGVITSIAAETENYAHINNMIDYGIPVVLFDRVADDVDAVTVTVDDYKGAAMVVEHLIQKGRKRIFHVAGPQHVSVWRNRCQGYRDMLEAYELPFQEEWVFVGKTVKEEGERIARQILELEERPDAIFCTSDFQALGVMLVFKENGIRVPEDIAIVGFANEPFDALISPSLTSVDQKSHQMGQMAAKILLGRLAGEEQASLVIEPELIERESSGGR